ncbi:MAG: amino acid adenylation domain-containing protein, partial [bacterium]|nr:amino acid adenylation domain-containing protein [bacterium]
SHSPLFQVFFNMLNLPERRFAVPGLRVEGLSLPEPESKFDLTVYVAEETDDEIGLYLVYNVDLFDRARMVEMLAQYAGLLEQIVAAPEAEIDSFSLVTAGAEKLLPGPGEELSARFEGTVHGIFAGQAARFPDHPAVVDPGESWSYGELDRRSNQLAHRLLAHGLEPQGVVAVYAHRSASLVWALLGILKAGGAFMILDPAYPAARLREYVRRVRPRGWLEIAGAGEPAAELRALVAELGCTKLRLPRRRVAAAEGFLADQPATDPAIPIAADDLAYVAFTSGSTGEPKGILGRHGALTHFLPWLAETFGFHRGDRQSLLSALSHDPLNRDVFIPLCYGATLFVPDPEEIGMPGYLADWVGRHQLTILNLVPAMLQLLCQRSPGRPAPAALDSLRYAFMVGDVLTRGDVAALYALSPSVRCVNYYGSTETQRALSHFVVPREATSARAQALEKAVLPLGKGIRGVEFLVLGPAGRLAGVGELGEIHVRSHHLALGYLDDEALTRERFFPNPFRDHPGDRLYRTGDLGRYLPDGNVEFAGRVDHQVQIRGYRIELGEIEAVLGRHPAVRECAVAVRDDGRGDERRLAAYVVAASARRPAVRELREHLIAQLPEYMVPAAVVFLDSLPLTPTGKVDRRALPAPDRIRPQGEEAFVAPQTPLEELVAGIWSEVLGVDGVGMRDNFFELGGHSLLATKVFARLNEALAAELPLTLIFNAPQLDEFVARLGERLGERDGVRELLAVPNIRPRDRMRFGGGPGGEPLPPSFSQERLWLLDRLEPGSTAYHLPFPARIEGELEVAVLESCLNEVVRRHESLRTAFATRDGLPVQIVHPPARFRLPVVDLGHLAESDREARVTALLRAEVATPFDLERAPLWRVRLLRLEDTQHVLVGNMHHIISDGWSIGVMFRELATLVEALSTGMAPRLPELPIQYADFAIWHRQRLRGERLESQLRYWRRQLDGAAALLELPWDRPRPAFQSHRGAGLERRLPASLSGALHALSRRHDASLFMTLLAAFKLLLHRYTGVEDVLVGTPIAGRGQLGIEPLIGFFLNILTLRTRLAGVSCFRELLGRVRQVVLEATLNQEVPFEKLLEELRPERSLSHSPLFQVFFNMLNLPERRFAVPGLRVEGLSLPEPESKFDLTVYVA